MNRRNLLFGALFSIVLIAGVAWYGEKTHFRALRPPPREPTPTPTPFVLNPDPVENPDPGNPRPQPKEDVVAPPAQPDIPQAKLPDDFTVPVEPPPVSMDPKLVRIPQGPGGTGPAQPIFDPGQLEQQPVAKYRDAPVYPQGMKQQGIHGDVLVDFIVDPSGNVRNAKAVRSTNREFEESACRAVSRWKFTPGMKGSRAVFVHMQVPIVFALDSGGER